VNLTVSDFTAATFTAVRGTTGDDTLTGSPTSDTIYGQAGNDTIEGGAGGDTLYGQWGDDTINSGSDQDYVYGGDGNDVISGGAGNDHLHGNAGNDTIDGNENDDTLYGNDGADTLRGGFGTDTLYGEAGNDLLEGGADADALHGGEGDDTLLGQDGADALSGGAGHDNLQGGALSDTLTGGAGNDVIDGGTEIDTAAFSGKMSEYEIISENGGITVRHLKANGDGTDFLTNVEKLSFSDVTTNGAFLTVSDAAVVEGDNGTVQLVYTVSIVGSVNAPVSVAYATSNGTATAGTDYAAAGGTLNFAVGETSKQVTVTVNADQLNELDETVNLTLSNASGIAIGDATGQGTILNDDASASIGDATVSEGNSGIKHITFTISLDKPAAGPVSVSYATVNGTATAGSDYEAKSGIIQFAAGEQSKTITVTVNGDLAGEANESFEVQILSVTGAKIGDGVGVGTITNDDTVAAPAAGNDSVIVSRGATIALPAAHLLANDTDPSGSALSIASVGNGVNGTPALSGNNVTFTAGGTTGNGSFTYTVQNASGTQSTGTVSVSIVETTANADTLAVASVAGQYSHVDGQGGNDVLTGGAGLDTLVGGEGADTLTGGAGIDTLVGGIGNDVYNVADTDDVIVENAGEGTDTVNSSVGYTLADNLENLVLTGTGAIDGTGNSAANNITGNAAANRLDGGLGADVMAGGLGDDLYIVDNAGDRANEASAAGGNDTVHASISFTLGNNVENLVLTGTGNTTGVGNALANIITGNDGHNTLSGAAGADSLTGGLGNDTYIVDEAGDVVTELALGGTDTVSASFSYTLGANLENLTLTGTAALSGTGNGLNNVITGNSAANTLSGGIGDDKLDGGLGADTMQGGVGNDTYVVDELGDVVSEAGGGGNDTVQSSISYTLGTDIEVLTLLGAAAIDGTGNAASNVLNGNGAANLLDGKAGADSMFGGNGDDTYIVSDIGDKVFETSAAGGFDEVQSAVSFQLGSNIERLVLTGTANINAYGNETANTLVGNSGNNTLGGGGGADTLIGGAGTDIYYVDVAGDVVTELAGEGTDTVNSSISWTLGANLENLILTGSAGLNGTGNELANTITGNSGVNTLSGLAGNDVLNGGLGADTLIGGIGNDTYVLDALDTIVEAAGEGNDTVQAGFDYTLGDDLEYLVLTGTGDIDGTGNALANTLTGNAGKNVLDGGLGGDQMFGGAGDDTYIVDNAFDRANETSAAGGTDTVHSAVSFTLGANVENLLLTGSAATTGIGNELANAITGNGAANTLVGGLGADTLDGGAGNDLFVYRTAAESTAAAQDRILAFTAGDKIDLSQIDAVSGTAANDAFSFIGTGAFTGTAGPRRAVQSAEGWAVEADVNGDGAADLSISVATADSAYLLSGADFIF
jgi:Ca2+-binding RTX toxin-like protein